MYPFKNLSEGFTPDPTGLAVEKKEGGNGGEKEG